MSFLAPVYLAALAAAAVPVLLHLLRNTVRRRVAFSVVRFVEPVPARTTRRMQVEHWPLLLLRVAAMCLLALAFARPFLRGVEAALEPSPRRRVVLLVDVSASMTRDGLWDQALAQVGGALATLTDRDEACLATFATAVDWKLTVREWNALPTLADRAVLLKRRIEELKTTASHAGAGETRLGPALAEALDVGVATESSGSVALNATPPRAATATPDIVELIVITDLQAGSRLDGLNDLDWPKQVSVTLRTVSTADTTNAGLQPVADDRDAVAAEVAEKRTVRVRVSNSADATRSTFQVGWSNTDTEMTNALPTPPLMVTVPPGQTRVVALPALSSHRTITLTGDDHPFDNVADIAAPPSETLTVLYYGNDARHDPTGQRYFLDRAFPQTSRRTVRVDTWSAPPFDPHSTPLAVIAAPLEAERVAALNDYVRRGGTVLVTATDAATVGAFAALTGLRVEADEAPVDGFALLTAVDFQHPVWKPFDDPQYADFSRIHIWKHRRVKGDAAAAQTLARYDDGDAALLEAASGEGRVLLLTTTWRPRDSQLALAAKFAPFLNALLELSRPRDDSTDKHATTISSDESRTEPLPPAALRDLGVPITTIVEAASPAAYSERGAHNPVLHAAVRIDAHAPTDDGKTTSRAQPARSELIAAKDESRQKAWRWLIVAALAVLLAETTLAARLSHATAASTSSNDDLSHQTRNAA